MERIAIVGLGPIGLSIGLGLKRAQLADTEVVGASADRRQLAAASRMGATDKATGDLNAAVDGAQMVVLDTSLADTERVLEAIGPILQKGCVVTDTGVAKVRVMEWAQRYMARGVSFVGGRPLPERLVANVDEADAALFENTPYCVVASESAHAGAVGTVVGMVETLGARPLFLNAHEHDSYSAAAVLLPTILSAALVNTTSASAAWKDIQRLAGPEFREVSNLASSEPSASADASLATPDSIVHWLDQVIGELSTYRALIRDGDDALLERFVLAWEQRAKWEAGGADREPEFEVPRPAETVAGAVIGKRLVDRYRQLTGAKRQPKWKYPRKS